MQIHRALARRAGRNAAARRSAVGQTFSAYVETERMNKARQELLESSRTVQEISESCGYTSPNSFYKAYKRCFGEAPLDIRKKG